MLVNTSDKRDIEYTAGELCPNCGQKVWDNTKKPKINPKSPDFKCSDKENCGLAMWIVKSKLAPKGTDVGMKILEVLMQIEKNTRPFGTE